MVRLSRYVAKFKKPSYCFQADVVEDYATGKSRTIVQLINLEFDPNASLFPWELDKALKHFRFDGLPTEVDEMTEISPLYRLSVFDSGQFIKNNPRLKDEDGNPVTVAAIDAFLDGLEENGTEFIRVEEPAVAAPWPAYPKLVAGGRGNTKESVVEKIAAKVRDDEYDVAAVVAFERQNLNRPEVIDALEALTAEVEETVVAA